MTKQLPRWGLQPPASAARVSIQSARRSLNPSAAQHRRGKSAVGFNGAKTHHLQLVATDDKSKESTAADGVEETCIPDVNCSMEVHPGKRGGRYQLPDGGCLFIPEAGGFSRTDCITVNSVQPAELSDCALRIGELECLVSPVYQLASPTVRSLRCQLALRMPLKLPDGEPSQFSRLRLLHRGSGGGATWKELPTMNLEADNSSVSVDTRSLGTYMMLLSPVEETFQISQTGGLIDFRIDQCVSLRVPKNAFPVPRLFKLRILPFTDRGSALARQLRRSETMDIASLTPMYTFHCDDDHDHELEDNDSVPMRRGVTVKLPMPVWLRDSDRREAASRLAVAYRTDASQWTLLDLKRASLRLTRSSVSFESKQLAARFCFIDAVPARLPRAMLGLPHMEALNTGRPGQLTLYAAFDRRRWALCVRCSPTDHSSAGAAAVDGHDVLRWQPLPALPPPGTQVERAIRTRRQAAAAEAEKLQQQQQQQQQQLLLNEGDTFVIELAGDFQLRQTSASQLGGTASFQYHRRFADNPVVFALVPSDRTVTIASDFFSYLLELAEDEGDRMETTEEKLVDKAGNETLTFRGAVKLLNSSGQTLSNHEFSVGFHALKQYLDLKPPPPPPPPAAALDGGTGDEGAESAVKTTEEQKPGGWFHYPHILKLRIYELDPQQARLESQQRLLAPRRNAQPAHHREPRALSRQSLQTLAQQVQHGVTLAAELGLPESSVSALGFETLSNRSGSNVNSSGNFTFRVLLYWKRACATPERGSLIDQLTDALGRMGRNDLVAAVRDCLAGNREITPERFGQQQQQQVQQQQQHLLLPQQ